VNAGKHQGAERAKLHEQMTVNEAERTAGPCAHARPWLRRRRLHGAAIARRKAW
jgi:hypothetical protein